MSSPGESSHAAPVAPSDEPPLCVDLDGTLVCGDTLHISLKLLLRTRPLALPLAALALLRGRPAFKQAVASRVVPAPSTLTFRADVVDFVRSEKRRGRRVFLATAAHRRIADAVAAHLGLFDDVIATEGDANAKGQGKVEAIRRRIGDSPFDYIGDALADLPVLRAARLGYLVAPTKALLRAAAAGATIARVFVGR